MRRCEDVKMRRCFTDPHYWKNPALRRSREKCHNMQEKIQSRIENMQTMQVFDKKTCSWSAKKYMINKKLQKYTEKMLYRHPPIQEHLVYSHLICLHMYIHVIFTGHICVYIMPFSEVTILFNQHFHYCREYRGKIPDGHSKPIYFVLKPLNLQNSWRIFDRPTANKKMTLKDRITPHVTNFFRLRLSIEKQEGKRKYKSDGAVMVGEFVVCVCVCMFMYSEWVRVWVSDVSVVCVSEGCESEWSEWSEVKSISYCKYAEHAGICKKTCSWSAKKSWSIKNVRVCRKNAISQPSLGTKILFIDWKSISNSEVLGAYSAEAF